MTVRPAEGERITVTLIPEVQEDLRRLQARTNLSKTDLANRAITLYEFFDWQQRTGRNMIALDPKTGTSEMVLVGSPDELARPASDQKSHEIRGREVLS